MEYFYVQLLNLYIRIILKNFVLYYHNSVGFEVFTTVTMRSTIFRDVTQCSPIEIHRRFRGTYASFFRVEE
jgi:hypothetical protein